MSARIEFRCGHVQPFSERVLNPACAVCGERIVARVHDMRPPRFVGCASGPHVETKALEAVPVSFAAKE